MKGSILAINSGSSSVKFASFEITPGAPAQRVLHGEVEGIGAAPRRVCLRRRTRAHRSKRGRGLGQRGSGLAAMLGGLNRLVFTGGIGEHREWIAVKYFNHADVLWSRLSENSFLTIAAKSKTYQIAR